MRRAMDGGVDRPRTTKRTRIARACNICRARKQRCDGRRPRCSTCLAIHQPCSYDSDRKKRGLPTGYVRSLELLWALVFTVVPNSRAIVAELMGEAQFGLDARAKLVIMSKFVSDPDVLRQTWDESGVQGELDQLLANVQYNVDTSLFMAEKKETPPADLTLANGRSFDDIQSNLADSDQRVSDLTTELRETDNADTPHYQQSLAMAAKLSDAEPSEFPQNSQRLLGIYFAYTHCWLPIVPKHEMFEILYSSSTNAFFEPGSLSTFWAILACSSLQESLEPASPTSPASVSSSTGNLTPEQMYAKARQLIPNEESNESNYAQAILILSIFRLRQGRVRAAWVLVGHAVRISLSLWTPPSDRRGFIATACTSSDEKLSRILLSCFVLDTLISCHLGKPPHLKTADVLSLPIPLETGPDEWEPRTVILKESDSERNTSRAAHKPLRAISIFNQYVGIVRILNDIISEPLIGSSENLQIKHASALRCWYAQLPSHCVIQTTFGSNEPVVMQEISPQLINLHLAFTCAKALLEVQQIPFIPKDIHTPSLKINRLVSIFSKQFGVGMIPAIFASYKVIGKRRQAKAGPLSSGPHHARSEARGNALDDVISSDFAARYLPTPIEYPESVFNGGSDKPHDSTPPILYQKKEDFMMDIEQSENLKERPPIEDSISEHEKELWKNLFSTADISELDISDHSFLENLDNLNGMGW